MTDLFKEIDPPPTKINPDYIEQPENSRRCIQCNKWHDTIFENRMTGERVLECDKCQECIMSKYLFKQITSQVVLHD